MCRGMVSQGIHRAQALGCSQTLNPGGAPLRLCRQAVVLLGVLDFADLAGAFTAAEFSFQTSLEHPGLGPDVMLNVALAAPEPGSLALVMLALACAVRRRGGRSSASQARFTGNWQASSK